MNQISFQSSVTDTWAVTARVHECLCACTYVSKQHYSRPVILNLDSSTLLSRQQGFVIVPHYPINTMWACGKTDTHSLTCTQAETHTHTNTLDPPLRVFAVLHFKKVWKADVEGNFQLPAANTSSFLQKLMPDQQKLANSDKQAFRQVMEVEKNNTDLTSICCLSWSRDKDWHKWFNSGGRSRSKSSRTEWKTKGMSSKYFPLSHHAFEVYTITWKLPINAEHMAFLLRSHIFIYSVNFAGFI